MRFRLALATVSPSLWVCQVAGTHPFGFAYWLGFVRRSLLVSLLLGEHTSPANVRGPVLDITHDGAHRDDMPFCTLLHDSLLVTTKL